MLMLALVVFPIVAAAAVWLFFRTEKGAASRVVVESRPAGDSLTRGMRYAARALALIWAALWTIFALLSGAEPGSGLKGILMNAPNALPELGFLVCVAMAWRWEAIGAVALLVEALLIFVVYLVVTSGAPIPRSALSSVLLALGLPPLAAGLLFLAAWRKSRASEASTEST